VGRCAGVPRPPLPSSSCRASGRLVQAALAAATLVVGLQCSAARCTALTACFACVCVCVCVVSVFSSKPRGIQAARQLRLHRKSQRWADKKFNKANSGTMWKCNPFGGSSHAKGIVVEKVGIEAKQPNSAIRKACRVQLIKNGKKVTAFVPNDGSLNYIDENDEVLVAGFGRSGKTKGDIPGCRFKVVKVAGVGLYALFREKKDKPRS